MNEYKKELLELNSLILNRLKIIMEVCEEANIKYSDSVLYVHLNSQKIIIDELIRSCFDDKKRFGSSKVSRGESKKFP